MTNVCCTLKKWINDTSKVGPKKISRIITEIGEPIIGMIRLIFFVTVSFLLIALLS